jgi:hypothetical protein
VVTDLRARQPLLGDFDVYTSVGDLSRVVGNISSVAVVLGTFLSVGNIIDGFIEVSPDYERLDFPVE